MELQPIGIIHSPFTSREGMPIQPAGAVGVKGRVEVRPEFTAGLRDLDGFSHVILLYRFHRSEGYDLEVVPFLDSRPRGLFATRAPRRPNPIGLSVVRLDRIEGSNLFVDGIDVLDGTPLLDLKPYVPDFDAPTDCRTGWLERAGGKVQERRSDDRFGRDGLSLIGGTRLYALRRMVPEGSARILLKLEYENPTGSMKDRMALAMVEAAERDGRLKPGGSVVEYTGGSTGVSLAYVCAVKGIPLRIVTSHAFSREKRDHMAALGARLTIVPSEAGGMTAALTREMVEAARKLAEAPGSYWTNQLHNTDQLASYGKMGEEIVQQTGGRIDAFVQSVGTCGSLRGIAARLRASDPGVRIVAVEPSESAVLSGGPTGSHKIEGVGAGFVVPLWTEGVADAIETVTTEEAMATARSLARIEGIFAGTSTGGNVATALRLARELGPDRTVVTVACDSGLKYLSTPLYREDVQS